jgi:hypothetical protein
MLPKGFEPAIPAGERPQTHAVDRAAAGIGEELVALYNYNPKSGALPLVMKAYGRVEV